MTILLLQSSCVSHSQFHSSKIFYPSDTEDFDFSQQTIPFPRSEDNITVTISIQDDGILERDEMFIVTLNVVPNLPAVEVGPLDVLNVTITDNEGMSLCGAFSCLVVLSEYLLL